MMILYIIYIIFIYNLRYYDIIFFRRFLNTTYDIMSCLPTIKIGHRQAGASEETAQAWCGGALRPSFWDTGPSLGHQESVCRIYSLVELT